MIMIWKFLYNYNKVEVVEVASGYDEVTLAQDDETSALFRARFGFDVKSHVILHTCKLCIQFILTYIQTINHNAMQRGRQSDVAIPRYRPTDRPTDRRE